MKKLAITLLAVLILSSPILAGEKKAPAAEEKKAPAAKEKKRPAAGDAAKKYFSALLKEDTDGIKSLLSKSLTNSILKVLRKMKDSNDEETKKKLADYGLTRSDLNMKNDEILNKSIGNIVKKQIATMVDGCCMKKGEKCCQMKATLSVEKEDVDMDSATVECKTSTGNTASLKFTWEDGAWKITGSFQLAKLLAPQKKGRCARCKGCKG